MSHQRRSAKVKLVLIGMTATLGACDDGPIVRDLYANRQDCVADWGGEDKCEPIARSSGSATSSSGGVHWGPTYSSDARGTGAHSIGQHVVSRGGFGSSARSFGGGS